ncbi:heat-inducible transcriptional repressor HrcA [Thermoleptolyngbya sp. C42_A2020_037]|uniref:heat-inducible transcriptional repressor HrcA n=1 Tax=Thermoleptolyngbya sp. C42_A2020_037 TaxID=2747799 RepID=UPI001A09F659|nr:heat-inducible transcriptional repressor HrcA [Thermoleptolyngbya sp. C42_A2020_037]MBF2083361.1 heat-inducible transcriptional repressor HrcA [Thermoleptolyngbya sp. C42_A2020_037]
MATPVKLNNRQQQVLSATVRQYIVTARPVGSEALVEEFNPRVSSATIRNVMGYLEREGLLYQPHTSAGRVPSDSGYRVYVDQLMIPSEEAARRVDRVLAQQLDAEGWSLEAVLHGAAQILSTLSGYIALVTMPQSTVAQVRHLQLVQIDPGRLMLIVVLDSYKTQSVVVDLPKAPADSAQSPDDPELLERELQVLSNFLNAHLKGRSLSDVASLDWSELGREFEQYANVLRGSLADLERRTQSPVSTQIFISGVAEVLRRHPEFSELHQVQTILHVLEAEQDQLWPLIFEADSDGGDRRVMIRIGSENPLEPMRGCTLISTTYHRGSVPVGSLGMLGPTRMMYENAIALLETTADYLSDTLSQS